MASSNKQKQPPAKPCKQAKLRICGSCCLIFKRREDNPECPYCGFGSYSAHWVIGKSCYKEAKKQTEWRERLAHQFISRIEKMLGEVSDIPVLDQPMNADTLHKWLHPSYYQKKETT